MKVTSSCSWMRLSSTCRSRRRRASSAPSGSSSSSTGGSSTSARASATRCCWPPESCAGRRCAVVLQAHQRQRLGDAALDLGLGGALVAQAEGDVVGHRLVREERVALEDRVDAPLVRRRARHVGAVEQDLALVGRSKPAISRSVVVLPQPDGPSMVKNSPGGTCRSMPLTATASPKRLTRSTSRMSPSLMRVTPCPSRVADRRGPAPRRASGRGRRRRRARARAARRRA